MAQDLLGECNQDSIPLDQFSQGWCSRCLNEMCSRSIGGKSRFEQRVRTWEEALFTSPPRMSTEDPRHTLISAQRFLTIPDRPLEVQSAWVDPHGALSGGDAASSEDPPQAPPGSIVQLAQTNARDQSGKILHTGGKPVISQADPWAAPAPPTPGERVISPGARIKLGSSGV